MSIGDGNEFLEIMYNLAAPSTEMKILLKIINKNIVKTISCFIFA